MLSNAEEKPHEMGSKKGNVKERRTVGRSQLIETIGSPHWTISDPG
jgi:hypothetical protein